MLNHKLSQSLVPAHNNNWLQREHHRTYVTIFCAKSLELPGLCTNPRLSESSDNRQARRPGRQTPPAFVRQECQNGHTQQKEGRNYGIQTQIRDMHFTVLYSAIFQNVVNGQRRKTLFSCRAVGVASNCKQVFQIICITSHACKFAK